MDNTQSHDKVGKGYVNLEQGSEHMILNVGIKFNSKHTLFKMYLRQFLAMNENVVPLHDIKNSVFKRRHLAFLGVVSFPLLIPVVISTNNETCLYIPM